MRKHPRNACSSVRARLCAAAVAPSTSGGPPPPTAATAAIALRPPTRSAPRVTRLTAIVTVHAAACAELASAIAPANNVRPAVSGAFAIASTADLDCVRAARVFARAARRRASSAGDRPCRARRAAVAGAAMKRRQCAATKAAKKTLASASTLRAVTKLPVGKPGGLPNPTSSATSRTYSLPVYALKVKANETQPNENGWNRTTFVKHHERPAASSWGA